jgi:hypothetical protein
MSLDNAASESFAWRKAVRSLGNGNCVEVASVIAGVAVRDSKDPAGPMLTLDRQSWREFAGAARRGYYDGDR